MTRTNKYIVIEDNHIKDGLALTTEVYDTEEQVEQGIKETRAYLKQHYNEIPDYWKNPSTLYLLVPLKAVSYIEE